MVGCSWDAGSSTDQMLTADIWSAIYHVADMVLFSLPCVVTLVPGPDVKIGTNVSSESACARLGAS